MLRSVLRYDPDIILIGEVRDAETAKIAVASALTGHLVLSTWHTNSAAQTITRLVEIGIPPYLVNATLAGVLAQRLVRRNCPHCRVEEDVHAEIRTRSAWSRRRTSARRRLLRALGNRHGRTRRGRRTARNGRGPAQAPPAGASYHEIEDQAVADGMVRLTEQALTLVKARAKFR